MKILVTGGCGYVGTNLTMKLLSEGHDITVVDIMWFGDYLKPHENLNVIQSDIRDIDNLPMEGVDVIIHLANISNDPTGDLSSRLTWEVNVLASKFLVEKAINNKIKQFIYASSGSVYGIKEELEVTEDLSLVPISDYNKTKMISERVLLSYKDYINIQCIRPATVCGYSPRMRLDLSVNMLTMQALTNKKITVFGGNQTRPNIHIKDMVGVYLHFLKLGDHLSGIYNAGFENITIINIANKIIDKMPSKIIITPSNDPRSYRQNSDKLLSTGFKPDHTIEDAINDVIIAFQNDGLTNDDKYYNMKTMQKIDNLF